MRGHVDHHAAPNVSSNTMATWSCLGHLVRNGLKLDPPQEAEGQTGYTFSRIVRST